MGFLRLLRFSPSTSKNILGYGETEYEFPYSDNKGIVKNKRTGVHYIEYYIVLWGNVIVLFYLTLLNIVEHV